MAESYTCPGCKKLLRRHCDHCGWYVCLKDKKTWVRRVVTNENQDAIPLWEVRDYMPMLMKPLP